MVARKTRISQCFLLLVTSNTLTRQCAVIPDPIANNLLVRGERLVRPVAWIPLVKCLPFWQLWPMIVQDSQRAYPSEKRGKLKLQILEHTWTIQSVSLTKARGGPWLLSLLLTPPTCRYWSCLWSWLLPPLLFWLLLLFWSGRWGVG